MGMNDFYITLLCFSPGRQWCERTAAGILTERQAFRQRISAGSFPVSAGQSRSRRICTASAIYRAVFTFL